MSSFFSQCGRRAWKAVSFTMRSGSGALGVALFAYVVVGPFSLTGHAGQSRTVKDGVYTSAQAARGTAMFKERCAICHDETLKGGLGPPLTGDAFIGVWGDLPLSTIVNKIQRTMPQNDPGKLTREQATDLVARILEVGRFPAGRTELSSDEAVLKGIMLPPAPPPDVRAAGQGPAFPPVGNLAQVMRGILFPSSNIIFNVQAQDPGAPRPAFEQGKLGFSWADWGAGIYSGWEMVDYAAIALSEAAPLLMAPGRRCENGKPVPLQNDDWVKFTQGLVEAGKAAYTASQTRNQMAVDEVSGVVADACLACHEVYREHPGGTIADPSNKAARCVK